MGELEDRDWDEAKEVGIGVTTSGPAASFSLLDGFISVHLGDRFGKTLGPWVAGHWDE